MSVGDGFARTLQVLPYRSHKQSEKPGRMRKQKARRQCRFLLVAMLVLALAGLVTSARTVSFSVFEDLNHNDQWDPEVDRIIEAPIELIFSQDVCWSVGVSVGEFVAYSFSIGSCYDVHLGVCVGTTPLTLEIPARSDAGLGAVSTGVGEAIDSVIPISARISEEAHTDLLAAGLVLQGTTTGTSTEVTISENGTDDLWWCYDRPCVSAGTCPTPRILNVSVQFPDSPNADSADLYAGQISPCELCISLYQLSGNDARFLSEQLIHAGEAATVSFTGVVPFQTYEARVAGIGDCGLDLDDVAGILAYDPEINASSITLSVNGGFPAPPYEVLAAKGVAVRQWPFMRTHANVYAEFELELSPFASLAGIGENGDSVVYITKQDVEIYYVGSSTHGTVSDLTLQPSGVGTWLIKVVGEIRHYTSEDYSVYVALELPSEYLSHSPQRLLAEAKLLSHGEAYESDHFDISLEAEPIDSGEPPSARLSAFTHVPYISGLTPLDFEIQMRPDGETAWTTSQSLRVSDVTTSCSKRGTSVTATLSGFDRACEARVRLRENALRAPLLLTSRDRALLNFPNPSEESFAESFMSNETGVTNSASDWAYLVYDDLHVPVFTCVLIESSDSCKPILSWNAVDNVTPQWSLAYEISHYTGAGELPEIPIGASSLLLPPQRQGENVKIEIKVIDLSGNSNTQEVSWLTPNLLTWIATSLPTVSNTSAICFSGYSCCHDANEGANVPVQLRCECRCISPGNTFGQSTLDIGSDGRFTVNAFNIQADSQWRCDCSLMLGEEVVQRISHEWIIDCTPPAAPGLTSDTSTGTPVSTDEINVAVSCTQGSEDHGSPIGTVAYQWTRDGQPGSVWNEVDLPSDGLALQHTVALSDVADGSWCIHAKVQDGAGWWSDIATMGPFVIDCTGPVVSVGWADHANGERIPQGYADATVPYHVTATVEIAGEPATRLNESSLLITNGHALPGSLQAVEWDSTNRATKYSVVVEPEAEGQISLQVEAGALRDEPGNASAASNRISLRYNAPVEILSVHIEANNNSLIYAGPEDEITVEILLSETPSTLQALPCVTIAGKHAVTRYQTAHCINCNRMNSYVATASMPLDVAALASPARIYITVFDPPYPGVHYIADHGTDGSCVRFDEQIARVTSVHGVTPNGIYGIGSDISIAVAFSQKVSVTGTAPRLWLNMFYNGSPGCQHWARYVSGSGTNTLVFRYTVEDGDAPPDDVTFTPTELHDYPKAETGQRLDGEVTDTYGRAAILTIPRNCSLADRSDIIIDAHYPYPRLWQSADQPDPASTLPIRFTLQFSEPVTGFTWSDIRWDGTSTGIQGTVSGAGATYEVTVTEATPGTLVAVVEKDAVEDGVGQSNHSESSSYYDREVTYAP